MREGILIGFLKFAMLNRKSLVLLFLVFVCLSFSSKVAYSSLRDMPFEGTEVYLGIAKGAQRIDVYVGNLASDDKELSGLRDLLVWNLEFSGFFRVSAKKDLSKTSPIVYIFEGVWTKDNNVAQLEGVIRDRESGEVIMSSTFSGPYNQRRTQVHRFTNFIISQLLGEKSPFPSNIVFVSTRGGEFSLMMMDFDGHNQRVLFRDKNISLSPVLSPDMKRLAYVSYKGGQPHVFLKNLETGKEKNISPNFDHASAPTFSPDGNRVAFAATKDAATNIYIYNIATSATRAVTNHWSINTQPSFSPTGNELSFTSDRGGSPQIYIVNVDGTMPNRISWAGNINENSSWSPSGAKVAFASFRHGGYKIIIKDIITGEERVVPHVHANNESPSWSPDGRFIAFESGSGTQRQIHIMNTETLARHQITNSGNNILPRWSF